MNTIETRSEDRASTIDRREFLAFVDTRPEPGFADQLETLEELRRFAHHADDDELRFARRLRDQLARCLLGASEDAGASVGQLCAELDVRPVFAASGQIRWSVRAPEGVAALSERLVSTLINLWETGDIEHSRVCAAENCVVPFIDTTATQKREFCSSKCATRTRVRRHRARRRR